MSDPGNGECSVNDDCTTDGNGQVSWTYSSLIPGTDTILASIGDTDIESNIVEKIWESVSIPTLSGWGIITTAGVLGLLAVIGLFVMRTRRTVAGGRGPDGANQ
ncbi:MAG: hypothetical protein IH964_12285 [Candidatus Dadabacteria bacterium]|nr:hypothetical protein [Candidatus Dadabacteria bacterium]